jgi:urease accessory protein
MLRATSVIAAGHRHERPVVDTVILDYAQRCAKKSSATSVKGRVIEIDLDRSMRLRTDDLLLLDDDTLVEVVAAAEPLIEARADGIAGLARLAWHLGDRHIAAQFLPNRIRARRDEAIEKLLGSLRAKVAAIEAPFEPEGGAYASAQGHDHHDHAHGHRHDC